MKKLLLSALLLSSFACAPAYAQEEQQSGCFHFEEIGPYLEEFGEVPILGLKNSQEVDGVVVYINPEKDTWTIVLVRGEEACIIDYGYGVALVRQPPNV